MAHQSSSTTLTTRPPDGSTTTFHMIRAHTSTNRLALVRANIGLIGTGGCVTDHSAFCRVNSRVPRPRGTDGLLQLGQTWSVAQTSH